MCAEKSVGVRQPPNFRTGQPGGAQTTSGTTGGGRFWHAERIGGGRGAGGHSGQGGAGAGRTG
jgi:hypothetical protein